MNGRRDFANDATGDALQRLRDSGDDLSEPRMIDFCFIFPRRQQTIAFAEVIDERDMEVCISYNDRRAMWQVIVRCQMIPSYETITALESPLADKASLCGGDAGGWGCMAVKAS